MDPFHGQSVPVAFACYALLLAAGAVYDTWKLVIPNAVSLGLAALFPVTALLVPLDLDWLSHLAAAVAVFLGGALLFRLNKLGGGDVKLISAAALWTGLERLFDLLVYVALAGGALALALLALRRVVAAMRAAHPALGELAVPRVLRPGESIPYGVAIAAGAILLGGKLPHLGGFL